MQIIGDGAGGRQGLSALAKTIVVGGTCRGVALVVWKEIG